MRQSEMPSVHMVVIRGEGVGGGRYINLGNKPGKSAGACEFTAAPLGS